MKKILPHCIALLLLPIALSCNAKDYSIETITLSDEKGSASLSIDMDLPVGHGGACKAVRQELIDLATYYLTISNERSSESVTGPKGLEVTELSNLFHTTFTTLYSQSIEYDCGMESSISIKKESETSSYIVFSLNYYAYSGGAHGTNYGTGITFDKRTGQIFNEFLKGDCTAALQHLIREGLAEYEEMLFEQDGPLQLPESTPIPTKDGLVFIYQQYEIAPYACGMPSFTIPYDKISPFLTEKALTLLGMKE